MLTSNLIPLLLENIYTVSVLNLLACFMEYHMVHPGECSMHDWKYVCSTTIIQRSINVNYDLVDGI